MRRYRYSFERYIILRTLAKTIGLSLRQAGEYDYQRKQAKMRGEG